MIPANKLTTEKFIERAIAVHGERFDYSNTVYIDFNSKLEIICLIHGNFYQLPNSHLRGHGCKKCAMELVQGKNKSNTSEFIEKANLIHKNKYDYTQVVYEGNNKKVKIICFQHGSFLQTPGNHLANHGCDKCIKEELSKLLSSNTEDFIKKANIVHNNFYNYSEVIYKNTHKQVIVICNLHGSWLITPANHLTGYGCPTCGLGRNISNPEILWLNSLNIPKEYRHKTIKLKNTRIVADAYDPNTNTIYEFFGDFYHGNPLKFNSDDINPKLKISYGQLHEKTLRKINNIKTNGYNLMFIWESEWENQQKKI